MNFVNNWLREITLAAAVTECPLDLPDGTYRLVIADGLGAAATRLEVIGAVVEGGEAELQRGLEDTDDQEWGAGSVIHCTLTAGVLIGLFAQLSAAVEQLSELSGRADAHDAQIANLQTRVAALEDDGSIIIMSNADGIMGYSQYYGSRITPVGTTVYPGGSPAPGALGELVELAWSLDFPLYSNLQLRVRGTYADWPDVNSLPFHSITIGSNTFLRSSLVFYGTGDSDVVFAWLDIETPFVGGPNVIVFNAE